MLTVIIRALFTLTLIQSLFHIYQQLTFVHVSYILRVIYCMTCENTWKKCEYYQFSFSSLLPQQRKISFNFLSFTPTIIVMCCRWRGRIKKMKLFTQSYNFYKFTFISLTEYENQVHQTCKLNHKWIIKNLERFCFQFIINEWNAFLFAQLT